MLVRTTGNLQLHMLRPCPPFSLLWGLKCNRVEAPKMITSVCQILEESFVAEGARTPRFRIKRTASQVLRGSRTYYKTLHISRHSPHGKRIPPLQYRQEIETCSTCVPKEYKNMCTVAAVSTMSDKPSTSDCNTSAHLARLKRHGKKQSQPGLFLLLSQNAEASATLIARRPQSILPLARKHCYRVSI